MSYYSDNQEKEKKRSLAYYHAHKPQYAAHRVRWRRENPERTALQKRRANLKALYGLTIEEYDEMLRRQLGKCKICGSPPKSKRLAVDHEHVRGFKKMPPEEKKKYIRGLLCYVCNRQYLPRGMCLTRARQVVRYFLDYHQRRGDEFSV